MARKINKYPEPEQAHGMNITISITHSSTSPASFQVVSRQTQVTDGKAIQDRQSEYTNS
jgi:hypothetical protein